MTIPFMGENRLLSYYVPTDYNPANEYRLLVSLHGLGDNSTNLRNALINAGWQSTIPNTIMVFVDGGSDQARDHLAPEGDENLIYEAIDTTKSLYNIQDDETILHGFSYGGRSALKIGLDDPDSFKGLYLSTPAIQGYNDLQNDTIGPLNTQYNYDNASQIPIVITVGNQDIAYYQQNLGLYRKLVEYNAPVVFATLNGGHTIGGGAVNTAMLQFIDSPVQVQGNRIQFIDHAGPETILCNTENMGSLLLRNVGQDVVSSYQIEILVNGTQIVQTLDFTSSLSSFESEWIDIGALTSELNNGDNTISYRISQINGEAVSGTSANSTLETEYFYFAEGLDSGLTEEFDNSDNLQWTDLESYYPYGWFGEENNGRTMLLAFNHPFYFHQSGYAHTLMSPVFDLSQIENTEKQMKITYAFAYASYDLQDGGKMTMSDTLEIQATTDCGEEWVTLYRASGDELATYGPIENSFQLNNFVVYPQESSYQELILDYPNLSGNKVQFRLNYISGTGGALWLDKIQIGDTEGSFVMDVEGLELYPNPARESIHISHPEGLSELKIVDINGRTVMTLSNGQKVDAALSSLAAGSYTITGVAQGKTFAKPFVKQ